MTQTIRNLRLLLHGDVGPQPIGVLSQYGDILRVSFDDSYIENPSRPTLSLSYQGADETQTKAILGSDRDSRLIRNDGRWPAYFQNLLPEGHNRERLANQRGCADTDEFELLAAAGTDLMGALEVRPMKADELVPDTLRLWQQAQGLELVDEGFVEVPVEDAASIPGVVTKFSAVNEGRRYIVKRDGKAGSYILKLPTSRHPDLVAIEFIGFTLLRRLGINCAHVEVIAKEQAELPETVPFNDILAVKRFDRTTGGGRVHMEEFAQVFGYPPRAKYGKGLAHDFVGMLQILNQLSSHPVEDVQELVNRLVAYTLMGNTDAHLKNWALIYPDSVHPRLAPAYDIVSVSSFFASIGPQDYALNRAIDPTMSALTWDELNILLKSAGMLRPARIVQNAKEIVKQAKDQWPLELRAAPARMRDEVTRRLQGGVVFSRV